MNAARAHDGLTKARERLFGWLRPLSQAQYTQAFPFGLRTLRATMIEIARGEWIYTLRLLGEGTPPRDTWPISEERQATFTDLEPLWTEQARRTREVLAGVTDWDGEVRWQPLVQPPGKIVTYRATRGDVATQLLMHEVHHRAQAMAMLRQLGVEAQNLDYSAMMFTRTEEPA